MQNVCGDTDLRSLSQIAPVARMMSYPGSGSSGSVDSITHGCTGTLISSSCMLSAGHCLSNLKYAQFNVPTSLPNGLIRFPAKEDEYKVSSIVSVLNSDYGNINNGQDWAVYKLDKNIITGSEAGDKQGFYPMSFENPISRIGDLVRVTGYGLGGGVNNCSQQTATGRLLFGPSQPVVSYDAYTRIGNSGSAVILEDSQEIIGIHTETGCYLNGPKVNSGSSLWNNPELQAAIRKCFDMEKTRP